MSGSTSGGERVERSSRGLVADAFLLIPTFTVNGMTAPPSRGGIPVFPVPSACRADEAQNEHSPAVSQAAEGLRGPVRSCERGSGRCLAVRPAAAALHRVDAAQLCGWIPSGRGGARGAPPAHSVGDPLIAERAIDQRSRVTVVVAELRPTAGADLVGCRLAVPRREVESISADGADVATHGVHGAVPGWECQ